MYNIKSDWIPPNYTWDKNGLSKTKNKDSIICSNAIPIVTRNYTKEHTITGVKEELIDYCYLLKDESITETQTLNLMQINKFAFMDYIPRGVVIYAEGRSKAKYAFHTIMQLQLAEMTCEVVPVYDYGWNHTYYYAGDFQPSYSEEEVVLHVLRLFSTKNDVIIGCLLAGTHGYITKLLANAGVEHNFTTYVYSKESGIGKSSVIKDLTGTFLPNTNFISISGKKSEIKKIAASLGDCPLLLDDVAETPSARIAENLKATTAELSQMSSDACAVVVDGEVIAPRGHYIISAQEKFNVTAIVNRYYLLNMLDSLSPELWNKVESFKHKAASFYFYFINFLNENYQTVLNNIKSYYPHYIEEYSKFTYCVGYSNYRITQTLAVQRLIKQSLYLYFKSLNVDHKILASAMKAIDTSIIAVGNDTGDAIDEINDKIKAAVYIPVFYDTIKQLTYYNKYYISDSESDYLKYKDKPKKKKNKSLGKCIGFVIKDNYFAFEYEYIFGIMKNRFPEGRKKATPLGFIKELNYFNLIRIDTDKRGSHRWSTEEKYHYINLDLLYRFMFEIDAKKDKPFTYDYNYYLNNASFYVNSTY